MGLIGNYVAIEDLLLNQIINGDQDLLEIDPTQYETLDIDKSWRAIHYLLCKDIENGKPPMGYIVPIRDENELECDLEFGAFYITAQQVKEASQFLNSLDDNALESMYDFKSMTENEIFLPLDEESFYKYIYFHLVKLRNYFKQTAEKGYAIIFYPA